MIDLERAKKVFDEYVSAYDAKNGRIELKIKHTYRTVEVANIIATELKLSEEDIELAKLIGLLHDVGRFEQVRLYNTFRDSESIDHAEKGVEVLFRDNLIEKMIEDRKYDDIIRKAISNHNKFSINEEGLNERELLHSKIIRDADKTDILFRLMGDTTKVLYDYESIGRGDLRDSTVEVVLKHEQMDRKLLRDPIEHYISNTAYLFDYNFVPGIKIVRENDYIGKMIDKIKGADETTKKKLELIRNVLYKYMDDRIASGK